MVDSLKLFIIKFETTITTTGSNPEKGSIPDSEPLVPGELGDTMSTLIGYAKFIGLGIIALALIAVAIEFAMTRHRGESFEVSGIVKVLVAAAIISNAPSLIGLFV